MKKHSLVFIVLVSILVASIVGVYFGTSAFASPEPSPQAYMPGGMYGYGYNYTGVYPYGMGMGMMGMMNPYYADMYNYTYPEGYMNRYPMFNLYNNTYPGYYGAYGSGIMPMCMMGMGMMGMNPYYNMAYNYTYGPYDWRMGPAWWSGQNTTNPDMGYPYGMGMMGMGMMPYYMNDGIYNSTYYGMYGWGMNPYVYGMNGTMPYMNYPYGTNNTAYPGYYGGCGMGLGYPYGMIPYSDSTMSPMPTPSPMPIFARETNLVYGRMIYLSDDSTSDSSDSTKANTSIWASPFLVAGLGIGFLAFAPVTWKLLHLNLKL
jgi:hypothetical protein